MIALISVLVISGCGGNSGQNSLTGGSFQRGQTFSKDASYALGMNIGAGLRDSMLADNIIPDLDEFLRGMRDAIHERKTRFDIEEARQIIESNFNELTREQNAEARQREITFLAENARKPNVQMTPSGLQYEIMIPAEGPKPSPSDMVQVHYELRLTDGRIVDNSYEYGEPLTLGLSDVIPGWAEGLQLMSVGSKYRFFIPSEQGYGEAANGPIPAYSTLIFIVDLIGITPGLDE